MILYKVECKILRLLKMKHKFWRHFVIVEVHFQPPPKSSGFLFFSATGQKVWRGNNMYSHVSPPQFSVYLNWSFPSYHSPCLSLFPGGISWLSFELSTLHSQPSFVSSSSFPNDSFFYFISLNHPPLSGVITSSQWSLPCLTCVAFGIHITKSIIY